MTRVIHLTDDPAMGGVNRTLAELMESLNSAIAQAKIAVTPTKGIAPRLDADIIVIHFTVAWAKLPWLLGLRARNRGATLILVEHSYTRSFEAIHVTHRRRFRTMLRLACGLMDRIVCVSAAQATWMKQAAGIAPRKISAINPQTSLTSLLALPPPQRAPGPLRLCAYGRYHSQKGFDVLIQAMRIVHPHVATLRLIGLGPDEPALRRLAEGLPHVFIEGPVACPTGLLAAVDAVIIPSRFEAFGNVGLEARAAARPILVTNVDGLIGQAMADPHLTVQPEDPLALAEAIVWLAAQDLAPLAVQARRSVHGAREHTLEGWNKMFLQGARSPFLKKRTKKLFSVRAPPACNKTAG